MMEHIGLARSIAGKFSRRNCLQVADREDAQQIAVLALLKAARTFDPGKGSFASYAAYRIRWDLNDWAKKRRAVPVERIEVAGRGVDMDAMIDLRDAMGALDPDLREVVKRRYYHGHTLEHIGRDLGITKQAVAMRERRALAAMREAMGDGDDA